MKYTKEELFKLIGELSGYSHDCTVVKVMYNPARIYNGFGEYEGMSNEWGYAVSTKICGEEVEVNAQDKELEEALWKLAQAIPEKLQAMHNRRKERIDKTMQKIREFLERDKPEIPPTKTPYRD